jgi:non-ribosomal peptide synthetase component F
VHDAFDAQAALTPDAIAVVDGERCLSYRALGRGAGRVAVTLRRLGITADTPVGLLSPRSLEAVVGLLAILKAGGAYVPIDSHDPDERIHSILEDAAAPVLLVHPTQRERAELTGTRFVVLDVNTTMGEVDERGLGGVVTRPENLAAIVYTSGSTARPKGVEIPHSAIMARVRGGYRPRRHDLQKAPLSVVAHFSDLLLPLISGGPVIIVPDNVVVNVAELMRTVRAHDTTRMVFVPSQLSAVFESGSVVCNDLRQLDSIIVSGEALTPALVTAHRDVLPDVALLNAYGASETAGLACMGGVSSPVRSPWELRSRAVTSTCSGPTCGLLRRGLRVMSTLVAIS